MRPGFAWFGMLLAMAMPAGAEVYTYIDANGNRVFTDRPGSRAVQSVDTQSPNRMPATPVTPRSLAPAEPAPASVIQYLRLSILAPASDATIRNNAGELQVTVDSEPALHAGHQYRINLDGKPAGEPGINPSLTLHNIDRGSHQLVVEIINAQGKTVQHSQPHVFHMMRTSLAQRRMVSPCKEDDFGVRPECPLADKPQEKDIPFVPFM